MLALRLRQGIEVNRFQATTGFDPNVLFGELIRSHSRVGLLETDDTHIALTRAGRLVGDAVISDFLNPPDPACQPCRF